MAVLLDTGPWVAPLSRNDNQPTLGVGAVPPPAAAIPQL